LESDVADLRDEKTALEQDVAAKEAEIDDLNTSITELTTQAAELTIQVNEQVDQIEELSAQNAELQAALDAASSTGTGIEYYKYGDDSGVFTLASGKLDGTSNYQMKIKNVWEDRPIVNFIVITSNNTGATAQKTTANGLNSYGSWYQFNPSTYRNCRFWVIFMDEDYKVFAIGEWGKRVNF
jgi:prefoldin subunit 5